MPGFDAIAFDGDDTLWHTEYLYAEAQVRFKEILAPYLIPNGVEERLYETETRNLQQFGYGIKGFALSLIESAIELTEGRITGREIQGLIDIAKEMLAAEVRLLDHVADTLAGLSESYRLMLITKGDLYDQESKIANSGLTAYFDDVEIVSNKTPDTYRILLSKYGIDPSRFLMVGNSLRSDILPVLEVGGHAVYIPHNLTWAHEMAELPDAAQSGFYQLEHVGQLPDLLAHLSAANGE